MSAQKDIKILKKALKDIKHIWSADMDNDFRRDLVVIGTEIVEVFDPVYGWAEDALGSTMVAWYKNKGDKTFTENVLLKTTINNGEVVPTDLDGDNDQDILIVTQKENLTDDDQFHLGWLRNDGSGEFKFFKIEVADLGASASVSAGDIDGDGDGCDR